MFVVWVLRERVEEKEVKGEERMNLFFFFYVCCVFVGCGGIKNCCMVAWI